MYEGEVKFVHHPESRSEVDLIPSQFVNDNFHGKGKYVFADGETYEGDFQDDVFCGVGVYHFAEGDVYEGEYVGDIMHGKGKYTFVDGRIYDGEFKAGRFDGKVRVCLCTMVWLCLPWFACAFH